MILDRAFLAAINQMIADIAETPISAEVVALADEQQISRHDAMEIGYFRCLLLLRRKINEIIAEGTDEFQA